MAAPTSLGQTKDMNALIIVEPFTRRATWDGGQHIDEKNLLPI
jgi:hypothetical protein